MKLNIARLIVPESAAASRALACQARDRIVAQAFFPLILVCLFGMLAWRHGLSHSPWFQQRSVEAREQLALQSLANISDSMWDGWVLPKADSPSLVAKKPSSNRQTPMLSVEQSRLAAFIVERYNAAADTVEDIVSATYAIAREQNIDPLLILAMVAVESEFDPLAQSPRGAQGLMQILTSVHAARFERFGGVATVFDPVTNLRVGVGILKEYLSRNSNIEQALKIYVGAANLPHDRGYGQRVMLARSRLEEASKPSSSTKDSNSSMPARAASKQAETLALD